MRIIDRRNQARGGQRNDRNLNQITHIVVHHTASARTATTQTFEQGVWKNQGWDRGGYHEVVLASGDVERNYDDRRIVWGAANQNTHTWHIALVGQHGAGVNNITSEQLRSVEGRIAEAMRRIGITQVNRVVVHNALLGQATACTSVNITSIRTAVGRLLETPAPTPTPPANNASTHVIRSGDTFWSLAQAWGVTVADIERANPNVNPSNLRVGQVINRPTGAQNADSNTSAGRRLELRNVPLFATATGAQVNTVTGTFFIWSSEIVNNRIRITNATNRVGVNGQVTGWVRVSDIR